ncbi:MAG: Gfo/Idh/MocA family oxidoreductase [Akkermansiaceae bacterium]|nr:Gfo/Idh/MocA family oxidoreductase [Akkermansiaceae bacterium]
MNSSMLPRRDFLKTLIGAAGGALAASSRRAAAEVSPARRTLRIGVAGCGGRGLGAAANALNADADTVVHALADAFPEQMERGRRLLDAQFPGRVLVPDSRCFAGLDGYRDLLESGVDVVLLATPPCFRPAMVAAAVKAHKHLYVEKPVAVDVPGALSVLHAARTARERRLAILDGFCWRYDPANVEAHRLLDSGRWGAALSFDAKYFTSPPKSPLSLDSRPAGEGDVSWALRNWTAWNWLSGGPFVEQVCHCVDGMLWSFGERMPAAAVGSGGRAQRTDDGDVWDHYDVYFDYGDGVEAHISCRQWKGCHGEIEDRTLCGKGTLITPGKPRFLGSERWRYRGPGGSMYDLTHAELFRCIRSGEWKQTLESAARKTLVALLGRNAAQTGRRLTWEELLDDTDALMPENLKWNSALPAMRVPVPGR